MSYQILNSQDFSVAQSRERLIYIAIRNDVMLEKNITPEKILHKSEITVMEIKDLCWQMR